MLIAHKISEKSIFKVGILENKYLIGSFIIGIFIQVIVAIIPAFANVFELTNLSMEQWIITCIISILPIPFMELQKLVNRIDIKKVNIKNTNTSAIS